jgi:protease I
MAGKLQHSRVAFLVANEGVEQIELTESWRCVVEEGATPELLAPRSGRVQAYDGTDRADWFPVTRTVGEAKIDAYDALVLPGGVANADRLRTDLRAVAFVQAFVESGCPVAAICHAPWVLVEADVVRDRRLTSWPSLRTDIRNAGGTWVDEAVVIDEGLVTSRRPADLPALCAALLEGVLLTAPTG